MRRLLIAAIGLALAAGLFGGPVLAGVNQPFTYEQTGWRSSPPDDPCYEEDDGATFQGYGRVQPGFVLEQTLPFCSRFDPWPDSVGPGGTAFWFLLVAHTDAFAVEIVSPTGLRWPLTIDHGKSYWVTSACVGDDHGTVDGNANGAIQPGDWQITVRYLGARAARDVWLTVEVGMQNDQPGDPGGCVF